MRSGPALYRTSDGGEHWSKILMVDTRRPLAVAFTDIHQGYLVGEGGMVRVSGDGGNTWHDLTSGSTDYLLTADFSDGRHGIIGGENGLLLSTRDGAETTREFRTELPVQIWGCALADSLTGWAVGMMGTIYYTQNGGMTWSDQTGSALTDWYSVAAIDQHTAVAVGTNGSIVKTVNGGSSWQRKAKGLTANHLFDVAFVDSLYGWAAAGDLGVIATIDGGDNWNFICSSSPERQFRCIRFVDRNHGWAFLLDHRTRGIVMRSRDGGRNWSEKLSREAFFVLDIEPVSSTEAWVAGLYGDLFHTLDGGESWSRESATGQHLYDLEIPHPQIAYAVGAYGTLLRKQSEPSPDEPAIPRGLTLLPNYPNPVASLTTITFHLSETRNVELAVYDLLGRKVDARSLGVLAEGDHQVQWRNAGLPNGLYFLSLQSNKWRQSRPMILLRR
ncbi:T9SS type A sorting domain-containing protein [candidate division KSB1 bacterium]|nr:T9SS type A sorting domain-containing protein [candidate division KSB1 bacterium]